MAPCWADDPQWDSLVKLIPEYQEAVTLGKKKEFFKKKIPWFIEKYGIKASDEAVRLLGLEAATEATLSLYSSRIENWFPNNTRACTTTASDGKRSTLEGKKRLQQQWQVYQSLYWDKGLKERANAECVRREGKPLADISDSQKRFTIRNRIINDLYKAETEAVCREVNTVREGLRLSPLTSDDIVKNLGKLPRTLKKVGQTISSQTEWSGIMVFGGPHPSYDGKKYTVVRHVGVTKEGKAFDEFLGTEAYNVWVGQLNAFFNACYDDDDRSRGSTAENQANKSTGLSSKVGAAKPTPTSASKELQAPVKSEYERTREINMARNQVVLRMLDKSIGSGEESGALVEELEKIGVKLDAEELKAMLSKIKTICSPPTINTSLSSPSQPKPPSQPASTANVKNENDEKPLPSETPPANHARTKSTAGNVDDGAGAVEQLDRGSVEKPDVVVNTTPPPSGNTNPPPPVVTDGVDVSVGGGQPDPNVDMEAPPAKPDESNGGSSVPPSKSLEEVEKSIPPFLKVTWKPLVSASDADPWRTLLYWFARFEAQGPDLKRLNSNGRPKQVQAWIQNHNKTIVPSLDVNIFSPQTLAWWKINQPEWRTTGVDGISPTTYHREVPDDADWSLVARGGTSGIYTVVMALSWWVLKATVPWGEDLANIVDNVTWVLRSLSGTDPLAAKSNQVPLVSPSKRAHVPDGNATTTASGRQVKRPRREL